MAKDAKGHGSEKRGANTVDTVYSSNAGVGGLGKGMYARLHSGQQLKLNPAATEGRIPSVGSTLNPAEHTLVGGGQPVVSNAHAAATLASGPKSAAVPVHNGADGPTNPRYDRIAVQNAINSSRQKIGGREAKMIHRLLSGGH